MTRTWLWHRFAIRNKMATKRDILIYRRTELQHLKPKTGTVSCHGVYGCLIYHQRLLIYVYLYFNQFRIVYLV